MDILSAFLPVLLALLDQHLPLILTGVGVFFAKRFDGFVHRYLDARAAKVAIEVKDTFRKHLGEALANGVISSTGTTDSQVAYDAQAYVERTMQQTIAKAGVTAAELAERALVEAKKRRRGLAEF